MSAFSTRKRWAVCVVIAFLATAISAWAIDLAGSGALQERGCEPCREPHDPCALKGRGLRVELAAQQSSDVRDFLPWNQPRAAQCIVSWLTARNEADFLLIPSYSALTAFIFLLLAAPRWTDDRPAPRFWVLIGVLLAAVMLIADVAENALTFEWTTSPFLGRAMPGLWTATAAKWGAVGLAAALAGVLALIRRSPRWTAVAIGLAGLATGALLAWGLVRGSVSWLGLGTLAVTLFFLFALIHAVTVLVRPEPASEVSPS